MRFLNRALRTVGNLTDRLRLPRIVGLCVRIIYTTSFQPEHAIRELLTLACDIIQRCGEPATIVKSELGTKDLKEWHLIWYKILCLCMTTYLCIRNVFDNNCLIGI